MSSLQTGQLFVTQAYNNCFKQLVPDMKKYNGQYTEQDQDSMTNCLNNLESVLSQLGCLNDIIYIKTSKYRTAYLHIYSLEFTIKLMNEFNILQMKREAFHTEIRRNQLEKIFSLKRKFQQPDAQITDFYQTQLQQLGKMKLLDLLNQINYKVKDPIIEMTRNDLAAKLCKFLCIQELYDSWNLFKQILQYLLVLVRLTDDYLLPYLTQYNLFTYFSEFFVLLEGEIFRKGISVKGNDTEIPLEYGETDQQKLSYAFVIMDQILIQASTSQEARKQLLKSKIFVHATCHAFHNEMDDQVLESHLQFISSLLQDLHKQDNDCRKHAEVYIKPVCSALLSKNTQKLNYILQILLNLTFVGMHNGYINQIFKFNGALYLMQILEEGLNDQLCLRILSEIACQSPAHIEILIKNRLLEQLKLKLASNSKQVQYQALWVVEFCLCGSKQFYDTVFQHADITNQVMSLLQSEDESVQLEACFTICAYIQKGNYSQISQLCLSRVHIQVIQFLQLPNEQLQQSILEAIVAILNLETWQGNQCHLISNSEREGIRNILENIDQKESLFSIIHNVLSYL